MTHGFRATALSIAVHGAVFGLLYLVLYLSGMESAKFNPLALDVSVEVQLGEIHSSAGKPTAPKSILDAQTPHPNKAHQAPASLKSETHEKVAPLVPSSANGGSSPSESISTDLGQGPTVLTRAQYLQWVRTHNAGPSYPRLARQRQEQGRTIIRVVIREGQAVPESIELQTSSGSELLDKTALESLRSWTFPQFQGAAELILDVPILFKITDQ